MVSVLMCASPLAGHVLPMLSVARELVTAGVDTRFVTGSAFAGAVTEAGAEFIPLPPEADAAMRESPTVSSTGVFGGLRITLENSRRTLIEPIPAWLGVVQAALDHRAADVIIAEPSVLAMAALVDLPREERPAVVVCGITVVMRRDLDVPPVGLGLAPLSGRLGRIGHAALWWLTAHLVFGGLQRRASELVRALTGRPLGRFVLDWTAAAEVYAQLGVPSFEYPRNHVGNLVYLGPVRPPRREGGLPEWWSDLTDARPVIHVAQGTWANDDLGELIRPTVEGLADEEVTVVVTTGRALTGSTFGELPGNVRVAEYLDYDDLMPHVDVFVTNGGYGSINAALRHGVPIVVAGNTEDKMETSARVAWSGVGLNLKTRRPSPDQVRSSVLRVLADPSFAQHAARVGADIARAPGPAGIAGIVRRLASA